MIILVLCAVAAFTVWWETYLSLHSLIKNGIIAEPQLLVHFRMISKIIFVKVLLTLVAVWGLSITIFHFLAGPLYRFEVSFKSLRDGDLSQRIHLRKGDELKGLSGLFNDAVDVLQNNVRQDREKLGTLASNLEAAAKNLDKQKGDELLRMAGELRNVTKGFKI